MKHNHITMESIGSDRAVFALTIQPEHTNLYGTVHGGILYTLADYAAGAAVCTDRRMYVTQTGSLYFLNNQSTRIVKAEAHVRHRGKSSSLIEVTLTGKNDVLLATGDFTFFCIGPISSDKLPAPPTQG